MTVTEFIIEHDGNTAHGDLIENVDDLIEDLSVVTYKTMVEEATTMKSNMNPENKMADSKIKMADSDMSTIKTLDGDVETTTMEYSMDETTKVAFSMQASFLLKFFFHIS